MTAIDIFEELGSILEHLGDGDDITKLQPKLPSARDLLSHYASGRSLIEALFLICNGHDDHLGSLLFGLIPPSYDVKAQELTASEQGQTLQVILNTSKEKLQISSVYAANRIILYTDFKSFSLWRTDDAGRVSSPFALFNAREVCEEIAFTGSIWASVYPAHYAIVTRTISFTFSQDTVGALFSNKLSMRNDSVSEERAAYSRLGCLVSPFTKLVSLDALRVEMQSSPRPPKLLSEHTEGTYTLRRYSPQRSSLFDFGEPSGVLSRGDFVTTYNAGQEEFHREFFLLPRKWNAHEGDLQLAAFDILHTLAIRRAKLFRIGFASCVYNILLPPVLLIDDSISLLGYALFPVINLYRIPRWGSFRRTLSMTFIVCPIGELLDEGKWSGIISRPASLEELYRLKDDLLSSTTDTAVLAGKKRYKISGPIKSFVELPNECTIAELTQYISRIVLERILEGSHSTKQNIERVVSSTLFTANLESRIATILLLIDWIPADGFTKPWERWLATTDDKVFCNSLFRTMFYTDYLDPESAEASFPAVRFKEFNIGNTLGADMHGMTLYNPQETLKFVLYLRRYEKYPNHSIVRWLAWQIYIDSALTSLRALIYKFHPILDDREDLHSIIGTLQEMVQEFVDFYDLDIRDYFYRKEYEKIRTLMQVDTDYVQLLAKFDSSKEDASLREQRLINKLIISLTLATVTITVLSTLAQIQVISASAYLIVVFSLSIAGVGIGYVLFDPIKHGFERLYNAISRLWRS